MAKINSFSVIALLACLVAANAAGFSLFQDKEGNPCPPCASTNELNPVCGNNGESYPNPSALKCHSQCLKSEITPKHFGPCHASALLRKVHGSTCPCITTLEYVPVCGTNRKTYSNKSILKCHAQCQKTNIQVKHLGKCA